MGSNRKRNLSGDTGDESQGPQATEEPSRRRKLVATSADAQPSSSTEIRGQGQSQEALSTRPSTFLPYPDLKTSHSTVKQTPFQQPSQLISFSYTPEHVQEFTDSALRYFVDPPLGSNLGYGYERWLRHEDTRGRIDALLKAVSTVKQDPARGAMLPAEIGVVAWRGVMTKILTAPYENRDGWELNVMFVNGTLYFEEHATEERLKEKNNMDPRQRSQTYYGYAFESYCTSDTPKAREHEKDSRTGAPPGWGGDVNTNVQWCSVVRTKLGDTRMIIGGEVDCVRGKYTGQTDTFVELKTSLAIRGHYDETKFERKLLKFYFQSFLLGVPEIVVGFRTPAGVVNTVQSFKTIQLPRLVRGKPGAWDPLVCLEWGHRVLTFLKDSVRRTARDGNELPVPVWRVKFVPGSGISVDELDRAGVEDVVNGEDRVGFLPTWYWEELRREEQPTRPQDRTAAALPTPTLAKAGWQI
ncbi:RAI1 like PD-XK nuclease-domain-containing protein [Crassisporium funariophilum]|nr:RAI1 like PD-XK nuclease-domain-containing protein [Crassisporium funariophilum]